MQICTSPKSDNHASTTLLSFFTGRIPFLLPNQRRPSTEDMFNITENVTNSTCLTNLAEACASSLLINTTDLSMVQLLDEG